MGAAAKKPISLQDHQREKEAEESGNVEETAFELKFTVREQVGSEDFVPSDVDDTSEVSISTGTISHISSAPWNYSTEITSAKIEVNTLQVQTKLIALFTSDAKLLEAEMGKLINAAYTKSPELKPYFLKMKKLLKEHADINKSLSKAKSLCETSVDITAPIIKVDAEEKAEKTKTQTQSDLEIER